MSNPTALARQAAARAARPDYLAARTDPPGRPAQRLTNLIRAGSDPDELLAIMTAMARGEPGVRHVDYQRRLHEARRAGGDPPPRPPDAELVYPTVAEQQAAIRYLSEWGYQKPAERLEVGPAAPELDLSQLSDEELAALEALTAKAAPRGDGR